MLPDKAWGILVSFSLLISHLLNNTRLEPLPRTEQLTQKGKQKHTKLHGDKLADSFLVHLT